MTNSTAKFTPIIELPTGTEGLRLVTVRVCNRESQYPQLTRSKYAYCYKEIGPEDFWVPLGEREVTVAIIPSYYFFPGCPTIIMVREEIERRELKFPDLLVTEAVLRYLSDELVDNPTIGVCGHEMSDARGLSLFGCVSGDANGISVDRLSRYQNMDRCYQFIAVVREVLIT